MFQLQFIFFSIVTNGTLCSSVETQVCHRSYTIAASTYIAICNFVLLCITYIYHRIGYTLSFICLFSDSLYILHVVCGVGSVYVVAIILCFFCYQSANVERHDLEHVEGSVLLIVDIYIQKCWIIHCRLLKLFDCKHVNYSYSELYEMKDGHLQFCLGKMLICKYYLYIKGIDLLGY